MSKEYTVRWEIEVSASSKRAAAKKARRIQLDSSNHANYYDVAPFNSDDPRATQQFTLINLGEKEEG